MLQGLFEKFLGMFWCFPSRCEVVAIGIDCSFFMDAASVWSQTFYQLRGTYEDRVWSLNADFRWRITELQVLT